MCGIAGMVNLAAASGIPTAPVTAMVAALQHRGPDESGLYFDDRAVLGHARLSIIDLACGTQPLSNEDETLWIAYNGELFNYPELHDELVGLGHQFRTVSDTEVIVHLFEEYGPGCLDRMNGQFAFAIWDATKQRLFLARDRFGILPLHYAFMGDHFYFASEVKALIASKAVPPQIDLTGISQIFTFWSTIGDRTVFRDVKRLEPGHYMLLGPDILKVEPYWRLPVTTGRLQPVFSFEDAKETVRELLLDATRIRLRADVPVGAYLSGGLDSSIISTLAGTRFVNRLKTFGIRFEDDLFDEGPFQDQMVAHLSVDHETLQIHEEMLGLEMPDLVWHCETPMLRTAPAPLFLLSQKVRDNGLKVVLTGEGSDEIFAGYNIFKEAKIRAFWSRQPQSQWRPLLLKKIYPYIFRDARLYPFLKQFYSQGLESADNPLFSHLIRWENTRKIHQFFSPDMQMSQPQESCYEEVLQSLPPEFSSMDVVSKAQYLESRIFLSGYLLSSQADRVAMAHGVEIRVPFLDHRLAEFLAQVPSTWKLHVLEEKHLLKKAFAEILPPQIARRRKHPYRAPIRNSLLTGASRELTREMLSVAAIERAGFFNAQKVQSLLGKIERQQNSSEVEDMALAGILTTQLLEQAFCHPARFNLHAPNFKRVIDRRSADTREDIGITRSSGS